MFGSGEWSNWYVANDPDVYNLEIQDDYCEWEIRCVKI